MSSLRRRSYRYVVNTLKTVTRRSAKAKRVVVADAIATRTTTGERDYLAFSKVVRAPVNET